MVCLLQMSWVDVCVGPLDVADSNVAVDDDDDDDDDDVSTLCAGFKLQHLSSWSRCDTRQSSVCATHCHDVNISSVSLTCGQCKLCCPTKAPLTESMSVTTNLGIFLLSTENYELPVYFLILLLVCIIMIIKSNATDLCDGNVLLFVCLSGCTSIACKIC